jgi:hypothetical protein
VWSAIQIEALESFDLSVRELPEVFRLEWFGGGDTRGKELKLKRSVSIPRERYAGELGN